MPDATLARLIRPTGSACVGRIRRSRRIRQWCPNATRLSVLDFTRHPTGRNNNPLPQRQPAIPRR
ncbi:hypothetical protein DVL14_10290 [Escherichia coli]|nr:hypothetical protein [Escherichia coli]